MQVIFIHSALCFAWLASAYYIPTTTTATIDLSPFSTPETVASSSLPETFNSTVLDSNNTASETFNTTLADTNISTSIATKAIATSPGSTSSKAAKSVSASSSTKPCSSKLSAETTHPTASVHCVTYSICKALTPTVHSTRHSNGTKTLTIKPTAKALATPTTSPHSSSARSLLPPPPTSANSNLTLPTFPLSSNTTSALSSFLNLILSAPESLFQKSDKDVSAFFSGLGSCLASGGKGLEADLSALAAPLTSFLAGFGANLIAGAEGGARDIGKEIGDKLGLGGLFHKRDKFSDLLGDVEKIAACMGNVANNSTAFDVGKCALDIGLLALPVGRLGKIRNLVGAAGGLVKVLKDLREGLTAGAVAGDSLRVLAEALGVASVVKACGFVAEDIKKVL